MSDSTVWIVNYAGHDHSAAEEFGKLDFLTRGYVSMGSLDRLFYTVTEAIEKTIEEDYLLLSGLIALNALAASIWLQRHGKVKMLLWDQKLGRYRELSYSKNQIDQLFEKLLISSADKPKDSHKRGD
jgi:hypothetical protein